MRSSRFIPTAGVRCDSSRYREALSQRKPGNDSRCNESMAFRGPPQNVGAGPRRKVAPIGPAMSNVYINVVINVVIGASSALAAAPGPHGARNGIKKWPK
jgi:hypothetical protein